MTATYSRWDDKYLLHIDTIDDQHKYFFSICARIAVLCDPARSGDIKIRELIHAICELRCYAFKHFHTEETMLVQNAYPDLLRHSMFHDDYLEKLRTFMPELRKCTASSPAHACADFLELANIINEFSVGWWEAHIMDVDKQYAAFPKGKEIWRAQLAAHGEACPGSPGRHTLPTRRAALRPGPPASFSPARKRRRAGERAGQGPGFSNISCTEAAGWDMLRNGGNSNLGRPMRSVSPGRRFFHAIVLAAILLAAPARGAGFTVLAGEWSPCVSSTLERGGPPRRMHLAAPRSHADEPAVLEALDAGLKILNASGRRREILVQPGLGAE
jgi:hemerythrin